MNNVGINFSSPSNTLNVQTVEINTTGSGRNRNIAAGGTNNVIAFNPQDPQDPQDPQAPQAPQDPQDHNNTDVPAYSLEGEGAKIKSSSLSYANAAGRIGFDFEKFYNDFTNEGHIYPVHGVGDLDKTIDLMAKFVLSAQGEPFGITDLGIKIKVTDESLKTKNAFFDFHNIPTKMLDGSTKLPDGTRVEQHIPYFTDGKHAIEPLMKIDWISGMAKLNNPEELPANWSDEWKTKEVPTSLASTRVTPFLKSNENLALTFFMDGKQSRVNNGGKVSNWRYVVPAESQASLNWFVAKAYVPVSEGTAGAEKITTTSGDEVWVRPRKASETENLKLIAYNQNRYMKTVSKSVRITNSESRMNGFNQRYGNKATSFGQLMIKPDVDITSLTASIATQDNNKSKGIRTDVIATYNKFVKMDLQFFFYEALEVILKDFPTIEADGTPGSRPYPYQKIPDPDNNPYYAELKWFKDNFLNPDTYNISIQALSDKAQLGKTYLCSNVGETGWMIVEEEVQLEVPDEEGEFFIGWSIGTQPQVSNNRRLSEHCEHKSEWAVSNGYKLAQGPGILFLTGGDYAHTGNQEPYILKHNYPPIQGSEETELELETREKEQLPTVHWRLDAPDVIVKSLEMGAFTEANVGAAQKMLASIGTKTAIGVPSRSQNFLGEKYQGLLADPSKIQDLVGKDPGPGEVYQVIDTEPTFVYGEEQQNLDNVVY